MTKSRTRKASTHPGRLHRTGQALAAIGHWLMQRELWGLAITALGAVTVISLVSSDQGELSGAWSLLLRQIFGVGAYPVAALLLASGVVLLVWRSVAGRIVPRWEAVIGAELIFFGGLGLLHILSAESPWVLAYTGQRGGYIGWAWMRLLVPFLGRALSVAVLAAVVAGGLLLLTGTSWRLVAWRIHWLWAQVGVRLRTAILARQQARADRAALAAAQSSALQASTAPPLEAAPAAVAPASRARHSEHRPVRPARKPTAALPPLDLLVPDDPTSGDDADARMRAQIIQETLDAFGVPSRVVEWRCGPVVTQFGVVPGYVERQDRDGNVQRYKIRVSKVLALANDLALALAASPIRIEAPVPGRAVIGIEVPNTEKAVVGLRGVLESEAFQSNRAQLRLALGRDVSGEAVVADLARMPHLLLAGATGTGKSACLNAMLGSLLYYNTPDRLRLLLVDPKRVELTRFNGVPHLIAPAVVDTEKVIVALRWVVREMEQRYEQFAKAGSRNLDTYNRHRTGKGLDPLPSIVVIIDELADVMLAAPDEVERVLCRIAQMARATGIHLVVATQRPSVDVVTGLIKANFPARISFAVTSQVDSRVILDTPGAEKLLGRGDMLFMAPDSPELQRIQGCWVSEEELDALIAFWHHAGQEYQDEEEPEAPPWEGMSLEDAEADDLLEDAIQLVRQHEQASASFLQRQMRIGYPRAARLIDELERQGVVGPAESGGRSRSVLQDEAAAQEAPEPDGQSDPQGPDQPAADAAGP